MRSLAVRLIVAVALAAIALLGVGGSFSGPARWSPDGLFYQARVYEIHDGLTQTDALRKAFQGPLGARLRTIDPDRSGSQQWVAYNARFYERRVTVPLAAAALTPAAGDRAILDVSIAGYVVAILALYWLLLLLGFRLPVAAGVAVATIFLPALTHHAQFPLTDSWGLALEIIAFAGAVLALRRGPRWLALWFVAIVLLSLTRDSMWIPVLAAGLLALIHRTRPAVWLAATGVAAALPAVIAIPVPMRELLAQMTNGLMPAPDTGWAHIAGQYPSAIVDLLQADGGFVRDGAWYSALYLLAGLALLFVLGRAARGGQEMTLLKAGALISIAYILVVPVFSAFRLELVLVPMAATGLCLAAQWAAERLALPAKVAAHAPPGRLAGVGTSGPNRKSGPSPDVALGDLTSSSS
jgi:hypothetical protein